MDSTCVDETTLFITTEGTTHQLKVNYFKINYVIYNKAVSSPIFESEGYRWIIQCYPNGCVGSDYMTVFLSLVSDFTKLKVNFTLAIFGKAGSEQLHKELTKSYTRSSHSWGHHFINRSYIEKRYLTEDGYFYIACSIKEVFQDGDELPRFPVDNIEEDISKLWESREMTDVNFEVEGEIISAHKIILAARSRIFKADIVSHKGEMGYIKIENIKPEVFRALLHFVYSNSLDNKKDTSRATSVMTRHLLMAAHRYEIEGLMVRCEKYLMENLSIDTVLDVLIFAEEHCHTSLKQACLEFALRRENLTKLVLTDGYNQISQTYPSLWAELLQTNFQNFLTPPLYLCD